ncbi:hypothetical protein KR009_008402 [Drosophila setifemur]|nr:hypothetical protein KR009_008402 [Drosophila setifemur]
MPSSADAYQMTLSDKLVRGPTTGSAFNLNDLDIDPYYSKERPEAQERAPLLPTPTFRDLVKAQQIYPYAVEASRSVRRDPQIPSNPRPVLWERRISHSSTLNETNLSVSSPPRYAKHIRSSYRTIGSPSVSGQLVRRRNRSPSVQRSSARIRGPHTPSQSPPRRRHVSARSPPKRRRTTTRSETRRRRLSSSSSSSRDSSQSSSYQSTTETSEEALLASHHNEKKRTSRKSSSRKLRKAEYQKPEKYYSRTPAKSSSRRRNKSSPRRSSKSRERSQTRTFPKSSKKRTPVRDPPKVLPYAPKKPRTDDGENKQSRKEYLLMKLLQVEDKIARKKKQSHLK